MSCSTPSNPLAATQISHRQRVQIKVQLDGVMDWTPPRELAGWKDIAAVANLLEAQAV
jgi:hypothetical protein